MFTDELQLPRLSYQHWESSEDAACPAVELWSRTLWALVWAQSGAGSQLPWASMRGTDGTVALPDASLLVCVVGHSLEMMHVVRRLTGATCPHAALWT